MVEYYNPRTILQRLRYISPNLFLCIISVVDSDSTVTNSPPRNELNSKDSSTSDISSSCSETQSDVINKEQTKQKPQPPPKPKMLVTQDGRLKPVPPPRPTKAS